MRHCIKHDAPERCNCGDDMGWCSNWDGILDENQIPSCVWREDAGSTLAEGSSAVPAPD